MGKINDFFCKYSWLSVVFVFIFLILAWFFLIRYANANRPAMIEIKSSEKIHETK